MSAYDPEQTLRTSKPEDARDIAAQEQLASLAIAAPTTLQKARVRATSPTPPDTRMVEVPRASTLPSGLRTLASLGMI